MFFSFNFILSNDIAITKVKAGGFAFSSKPGKIINEFFIILVKFKSVNENEGTENIKIHTKNYLLVIHNALNELLEIIGHFFLFLDTFCNS
jgi:hypothetical protein